MKWAIALSIIGAVLLTAGQLLPVIVDHTIEPNKGAYECRELCLMEMKTNSKIPACHKCWDNLVKANTKPPEASS